MAQEYINYASWTEVFAATDLDSLASSATWVAGRESSIIDNSSLKYSDYWLAGQFKAHNTAPTAGQIQVWVGSPLNASLYPDVFDGTGSNETITSQDIRNAALFCVAAITTDATSNRIYPMAPRLIGQYFGGLAPQKWFVFVTHSMVQNLNATSQAGGQCWHQGVYRTIA